MAIKKWKILDQSIIFEHQRITLLEDTVKLPNQKVTKYLRFKHDADAATIIAINNNGQILLQREYSHPPNEVLFQFPGGGIPLDEDIIAGANRELMEECGLSGTLNKIGECYIDNRRSSGKMHFFVATDLKEAKLSSDEEEFIEHDWYMPEQVDNLISQGEIKNAFMLAGWTILKQFKSSE
ncbi:MAG: NUDIX hydrolase [Candidatus Woesebacteria bacterium]|jgi:8-oxo-dGTP pyrophosphatase MutT (NUDIX family)